MPTVTVEFIVRHHPAGNRLEPWLELASVEEFWAIADLGFEVHGNLRRGEPEGQVTVKAAEDDPRLAEVFRIAARHGFFPCPRLGPRRQERGTHFPVSRRRHYSAGEMERADLLCLNRGSAFGKNTIAETVTPKRASESFSYEEGQRRLKEAMGTDDTGWRVRGKKTVNKRQEWGQATDMLAFLMGAELKTDLESAGLLRLSLRPVLYDDAQKAERQLWAFGHEIKMPPCLVPRVEQGYGDFPQDSNSVNGALWDDMGIWPAELRFRRAEVEAMGPFDAATTREKVGAHSAWMMSEVIVTQRFRHTLEALQVPNVEYIPVWLVD